MRRLLHIALLLCFAGSVFGNIPRNGGFRYQADGQMVAATGLALGAASVSATLNGNPANVQFDGTDAEGRWRAMLDMTSGSNTLRVAALHPSGQYTAYASNTFNTIGGADTVTNALDGSGNVTKRVWLSSNGQTNRTQAFTWDAFDRLIKVSERDAVGSGQDWVGIFDGLGRKVRTVTTLVVSNAPITSPANAVSKVDSWFDPQVEFQEVAVVVNGGVFNMKTYGPDANGVHGGLQGVGGLERVTPFGHISGIGLLQDYFGNIVGSVTSPLYGITWNPARFSSIGPVPGYQQSALTLNTTLAQSVGWRGKHLEAIGTFHWGARPYEPASGRFLAHDPMFDSDNPSGFSMCGGDMLSSFDPDARYGKQAFDTTPSPIQEWYNSTVLAPIRQLQEDATYNDQFVGVREARENFWKGTLNLATLGLYNCGSIAFTGYDIYDQRPYGTERGIAVAEFSLAVASVVPWGRVAALGGDAAEFSGTRLGEVGTFLDETTPILNPVNYRYDPATLYGGLPLPEYTPPTPGSGLSVVPRLGMSFETVNNVPIYGQIGSSSTTAGHTEAMSSFAQSLAQSGNYEYITLQRSWRTATGRIGTNSLRPDVIGVQRNGLVDAWEVQSATDIEAVLRDRLREGMQSLPIERQGRIGIISVHPRSSCLDSRVGGRFGA